MLHTALMRKTKVTNVGVRSKIVTFLPLRIIKFRMNETEIKTL